MWKNLVEPGRPQVATRRMPFSCWITKAANTHSEYVTLIAFPPQQKLHEHISVLLFTYIACVITTNLTMPYKVYNSVVYTACTRKVTVNNELDKYGKRGLWIYPVIFLQGLKKTTKTVEDYTSRCRRINRDFRLESQLITLTRSVLDESYGQLHFCAIFTHRWLSGSQTSVRR